MKKIFSMLLFGFLSLSVSSQTAVSVAGFFPLPEQVSRGSGRTVYNFNLGWRFHRGDVAGAEAAVFDDLQWEVVSIPHSVQLMPSEASGCRNYQGIAWYRKRFVVPEASEGKDVSIHFEAAMGKQVLYLNGDKVGEHQGGYLPFNLNLTDQGVVAGDTCVVAVMVDNSNDKTFPPGKPQYTLDFSYHGGIYRDVWLISKGRTALTDAVEANRVAGGGVFVHAENISEQHAEVVVKSEVENKENRNRTVTIETVLVDAGQRIVGKKRRKLALKAGEVGTVEQRLAVRKPKLWTPETPYLYHVQTRVLDGGILLDGGVTRIGIRSFVFDAEKGLILNGKPYGQLVGANRHQDFAYVGNALPNSQQWRDAKRLRDAGCTIIRTAHYPQDPLPAGAGALTRQQENTKTPGYCREFLFRDRNPVTGFSARSARTPRHRPGHGGGWQGRNRTPPTRYGAGGWAGCCRTSCARHGTYNRTGSRDKASRTTRTRRAGTPRRRASCAPRAAAPRYGAQSASTRRRNRAPGPYPRS